MNLSTVRRELLRSRAANCCEYCRLPEAASTLPHQFDHIIANQHGGSDDDDNLCLCCIRCNLKKGPNIATIDPASGLLVSLFHPRRHVWNDHIAFDPDGGARGLSAEGRATVRLLGMNDVERLNLRWMLIRKGRMPLLAPPR